MCQCNSINDANNKICQTCFIIKPGENGWVCIRCHTYNNDYDKACRICDSECFYNSVVNFTEKICQKCGIKLKNGINCGVCSEKKENFNKQNYRNTIREGYNIEIARPKNVITKCSDCKTALASPYFCSNCLKIITASPCLFCRSPQIICNKCMEKRCKICKNKLENSICKVCNETIKPTVSKFKQTCKLCNDPLRYPTQ